MNDIFAVNLRKLREEKGLTQKQLGQEMFVNRTTVARWENGSRLPDAAMMLRLAKCLDTDVNMLLRLAAESDGLTDVVIVDDRRVALADGLAVLEEAMPYAAVTGFIWPQEVIEYAKANPVALAVLDIEPGTASGLDLCRALPEINPRTNVVFPTAYADCSLDARNAEASGFLLKPLAAHGVRDRLKKLRFSFQAGGADG